MKSSRQVLIVDSDPKDVRILLEVLDSAGVDVHVRTNGRVALEAFHEIQPDLVLVSGRMQGRTGSNVLQEIQHSDRGKQTPIIVLGEGTEPGTAALPEGEGWNGTSLDKPLDRNRLLEALARFMPGAFLTGGAADAATPYPTGAAKSGSLNAGALGTASFDDEPSLGNLLDRIFPTSDSGDLAGAITAKRDGAPVRPHSVKARGADEAAHPLADVPVETLDVILERVLPTKKPAAPAVSEAKAAGAMPTTSGAKLDPTTPAAKLELTAPAAKPVGSPTAMTATAATGSTEPAVSAHANIAPEKIPTPAPVTSTPPIPATPSTATLEAKPSAILPTPSPIAAESTAKPAMPSVPMNPTLSGTKPSSPSTPESAGKPAAPGTYATTAKSIAPETFDTAHKPAAADSLAATSKPIAPGAIDTAQQPAAADSFATATKPVAPGSFDTAQKPSTPGSFDTATKSGAPTLFDRASKPAASSTPPSVSEPTRTPLATDSGTKRGTSRKAERRAEKAARAAASSNQSSASSQPTTPQMQEKIELAPIADTIERKSASADALGAGTGLTSEIAQTYDDVRPGRARSKRSRLPLVVGAIGTIAAIAAVAFILLNPQDTDLRPTQTPQQGAQSNSDQGPSNADVGIPVLETPAPSESAAIAANTAVLPTQEAAPGSADSGALPAPDTASTTASIGDIAHSAPPAQTATTQTPSNAHADATRAATSRPAPPAPDRAQSSNTTKLASASTARGTSPRESGAGSIATKGGPSTTATKLAATAPAPPSSSRPPTAAAHTATPAPDPGRTTSPSSATPGSDASQVEAQKIAAAATVQAEPSDDSVARLTIVRSVDPITGSSAEELGSQAEGGSAPSASGLYTSPIPVQRSAPDYPRMAVTMRQSGTVRLLVKVGPDGHVQSVKLMRGVSTLLDQAAISTAYGWTYKPALQAGNPVVSWTEEVVDFKLK